jgi:hypothetical protein
MRVEQSMSQTGETCLSGLVFLRKIQDRKEQQRGQAEE